MGMNPQITTVEIGVKSLQEVTIYPLSIGDQFKMTDLITTAIQDVVGSNSIEDFDDAAVIQFAIDLIRDNLEKFLSFVIQESEKISFGDITNEQLFEIIQIIFTVNYEGVLKNGKDLVKKIQENLGLKLTGSLPKSLKKPITD